MKKQKNLLIGIMQSILGIMMIAAFLFFIIGEAVLPPENLQDIGEHMLYSGKWEQVLPDGERVEINVPGECSTKHGEWVTIESTLPDEMRDISFCIRSMQQDFKIYIGDELRREYSTIDTQLFGKTSTISYVFFEGYRDDAGKTLRIEFMSDSSYAGYVSEIYMGDRIALWQSNIKTYAPALVMAMFMLILGIGVSVLSILFQFFYKTEVELLHLGNGIVIAASWMIAESRLRQFILPNSTMAVYLGFFMIMLLPYSLGSYINKVQNRRYQKAYTILSVAVIINCIFATTLQVLEIKDFFETMLLSHIIIGALIIIMIVTIVMDIRHGNIQEYRAVAIGFAGLIVAGIGEIGMVYINSSQYNGIPLCIGMVFLLITAGMKTRKEIQKVDQERKLALAVSESKTQFLANISHEIRTPINTIVGMNEMILRENDDETTKEYAYNIKSASEMLLGLINDVLDLSKIEAGKLQIVEGKYTTASMLKAVILGIEIRAQQKKLEMKLDIDENLPATLKGDEIRIKQILNNLLSNAVKYTEKGSVTLRAKGIQREETFFLQLAVEDTGMGISQEDMEHLFDTFLRFDLKKNQNIEGTSELGKGSCFKVEIPQEVIDASPMGTLEAQTRNSQQQEEQKKEYFRAPDAMVLVVDDNKMNLKVIGALLKRTEIQLDYATGGNECLEMTREKKYDLIFMDHMMPEPDGVQTLHLLRGENGNINQNTPVIVLTANAVGDVAKKYMEEGFEDYLSKPIEVEAMESTLKKYL